MIRSITIFAGILISSLSQADTIKDQYILTDFPDTHGSCFQVAEDLGERFTARYGIDVTGECVDHTASGYTIAIHLPEGLELELTTSGKNMFNINGRGQYASREACQQAMAREESLFSSATGLQPFTSWCFKGRYLSDRPWALRTDAIGLAAKKPFNQHAYIFGTLVDSNDAFLGKFKNAIRPFAVQARQLVLGNEIELGTLSFYYYSEVPVDTEVHNIATYESDGQCANSLATAESIETTSARNKAFWFCSKASFSGKARLHRMQLFSDVLNVEETIQRHETLDGCRQMLAATADDYRNHRGVNVHGAFCGRPDNSDIFNQIWKVILITD